MYNKDSLFNKQSVNKKDTYLQLLKATGALSNLFSENKAPYLVPRNVENVYCEAFGAKNLGRADCSADASLDKVGVGIKTFLHNNGRTLQKVAEFNKDAVLYRGKSEKDIVSTIAELRNERIEFTMRTYDLDEMIYHCVTRKPGKILIFEEPMHKIDTGSIHNVKVSNNGNSISFSDNLNEYNFNRTKSTLLKRFNMIQPIDEVEVNILENPYIELAKLFGLNLSLTTKMQEQNHEDLEHVILPLFSDRGGKRHVPEKSGLNQWNASGRTRNPDEIYIPIPSWINKVFHGFFPPRDQAFSLELPDGEALSAKVCQDNRKALMSNPNKALGEWLLRKVMNLKHNELLTYDQLKNLGIDSVIVYKKTNNSFLIDFQEVGSYDSFEEEYNN